MNSISWIVGHVSLQQHAFFVAWPCAVEIDPRYDAFGTGSPPSQPSLDEVMGLWRASCDEADVLLNAATEGSLRGPFVSPEGENLGTLLVRAILHTWHHVGEINSIRQMLGHQAPEFVELYGWTYAGM